MLPDSYIDYISGVRRYSPRTCEVYAGVLDNFSAWCSGLPDDSSWAEAMTPSLIRGYEVYLMDTLDQRPVTVNLHLSVLSGLARYMIKEGLLDSNPVRLVPRPQTPRRLPTVFRQDMMEEYFARTRYLVEEDYGADKAMYVKRLDRMIVSLLYQTGVRRAELIGLRRGSFDAGRRTLLVRGKGDKERVLPLTEELCSELSLYLDSAALVTGCSVQADAPLLVTLKGSALYPVYVDRVIKRELSDATVRRSPHVLRHTLATELMDDGADLNSIKEMLGHSSLAATQVYTHNSIERLRSVYQSAHPLAKEEK